MYSEVLKLLGLRKFGRGGAGGGPAGLGFGGGAGGMRGAGGNRINKMYGSMSSLPSVSSIGSRPLYKDKLGVKKDHHGGKRPGSGGGGGGRGGDKANNKRFQRLESHVVTLARSVAHLSSELRSQQILLQGLCWLYVNTEVHDFYGKNRRR